MKMRVGEEFQAELPACVRRPHPDSMPTDDEGAWLQQVVMSAGKFGAAEQAMPVVLVQETDSHQR